MNIRSLVFPGTLAVVLLFAGCAKDDGPVSNSNTPAVRLSVGFSADQSGSFMLAKGFDTNAADSLRIDSAVVVFNRIKFESHIDSVIVDSSGSGEMEMEQELEITFRGPFVVHIRDTAAINFASQTLPAGTYDGIKFKIHRLTPGEHHEDSDEYNRHPRWNADSSTYGSSIVVWGQVKKNGVWTPFTFAFDGEMEFKIKGNFTVPAGGGSLDVALRFDLGKWFRDPRSGALLDPTDGSQYRTIWNAIRASFQSGRGGRDRDHDGHPDD